MLNIINVSPIIGNHFRTLREDTSVLSLILLFLLFPGLLSGLAVYFNVTIVDLVISPLIASFSIFIGFTINVLILLLKMEKEKERVKNKLLKHLSYNALYELILGLFVLIMSLIIALLHSHIYNEINIILNFILFFMMINFFFTLLIIAKRIFVIFQIKIKEGGTD